MADNITTTLELNAKDNTKAAFAKLNSNIKKTPLIQYLVFRTG